MPRAKANASAPSKPVEPEKPVESDERVDLDEDNDPDEAMDEEVEYEEVEVEEEVEEVEEEVEEEEVEEEVEEEEEEEEEEANEAVEQKNLSCGVMIEDEDESKKHAELLALPPHGSEVYVGGIPQDASEEELKSFCKSVGEVTEVSHTSVYQVESFKCSV